MIGAVSGDIIGSVYEWHNVKTKDFPLFTAFSRPTDDTVMSAAAALALMLWDGKQPNVFGELMVSCMQRLGRSHPGYGYGGRFEKWIYSACPQPYNSWGNGSAMRVAPVGFYAGSLEQALALAEISAGVTHNHPQGIKGAQAAAAAIYIAKTGGSKNDMRNFIQENFYDLDFTLDQIRPEYSFDVSCQGSVPQAIEAFLEGTDFEDVIRNAVSIGGDSDTIACIAGGIAEAFYGVPVEIKNCVFEIIGDDEIADIIKRFDLWFCAQA